VAVAGDDPFGDALDPTSGVGDLTGDFVEISTEVVGLPVDSAALTIARVGSMAVDELRAHIPKWLCEHVVEQRDVRAEVRARIDQVLEGITDDQLRDTLRAYRGAGQAVRFHPHDPASRLVGREFVDAVLPTSAAFGVDALERAVEQGPCLVVSNHLSYADGQFTDLILSAVEEEDVSDRLVFLSGPAAYDHPYRRLAALGINALPAVEVPPRSGSDKLSPDAIRRAHELMRGGYVVVLYPEFLRSRTGRLRSFVGEACRFADLEGLRIVPLALTGTEEAFPIHQHLLGPAPITLSVAEPVEVSRLGPEAAMAAAWHAIAEMLPDEYQPARGTSPLSS